MKRLLTFLRGSLHTIANTVVVLVVLFYMGIHFNVAGILVEHSLTDELAEQLGTRVTVDGDIEVDWLNQIVINRLTIYDQKDDTLIYARRVLVAYDLLPLLSHHLVLNTCQLIDFDIRTSRPDKESEPNYQFLIDAFRKDKDPDSKPFIQQLDLNTILLRQGSLSYHVKGEPVLKDSPIDPNHVDICHLSANVHLHDKLLLIKKFHCQEKETHIEFDQCQLALYKAKLLKSEDKGAQFLVSLKNLTLSNQQFFCHADAEGTTEQIQVSIKSLELPSGHPKLGSVKNVTLHSDVILSHLKSSIDSLYVQADVASLSFIADKVGHVSLQGRAEGTKNSFTTNIKLMSDAGDIVVQATANNPAINAQCSTTGIDLSQLLPDRYQLGKTSFDLQINLPGLFEKKTDFAIDGTIGSLIWKEHNYRDIAINCKQNAKHYQGGIALIDSLVNADVLFDIDLNAAQNHYKVDGEVASLNLNGLHLCTTKALDSLEINTKIHADILTSGWKETEGELRLTQLWLKKGDESLELEPLLYEGTADRGAINSSLIRLKYDRNRKRKEYKISGKIVPANEILALLRLPFTIDNVATFDLHVDSATQLQNLNIDIPRVSLDENRNLMVKLDTQRGLDGLLYPALTFCANANQHCLKGTINGAVDLSPLEVTLEPTKLYYNEEPLSLSETHIRRTTEGDIHVDDFSISGMNQELAASGSLGTNGDKDFVVSLKNFDLGQILNTLPKNYMHFSGHATGDIVVVSKPEALLEAKNLEIKDFCYIDTLVGDAMINAEFSFPHKHAEITCDINSEKKYNTHIDCDLKFGKHDSIDLRVQPERLPIGFISNWCGSILQEFSGRATGYVRLYGDLNRLDLEGSPVVDGRFTHSIIGAHFHLNDTVHLSSGLIHLANATVDDCHGHSLLLNAKVTHDHLRHFGYDVDVNMPDANQGFLVLDRKQAPGRIYWGQLYAKGHAHLKGGDGKHRFNLNVGTTDKSWFYLSPREQDLNPDQDAYTFLTFRDKSMIDNLQPQETEATNTASTITTKTEERRTDLQVDMQVNASEQCQVYVQMDPLAEDKLICRGNGNLSVRYDPRRDITLAGTYHITQGNYTMNMKGDLMSKVFKLKNSSNVRFNGVPSEAELSLDANYNIPSVNLTDLDQSITSLSSLSRSTAPVDCNLSVTGQLTAPQVRFDLEVKNVSDEIQAYVHNIIGTQEMLNQEVLYLLLFSKFYTPQYAQASQNSNSTAELTSFASASITSQLNQLLSHVSNNFSMGTNFRSDKGDFSDMEMDLSLSTRLLGDRLLLNGNLGYRDPANRVGATNRSSSFIGDFDLEFLINSSGTLRAKAYSHYNDRDYSINNSLTTQGIGFILRKDFMGLKDLWPWRIWNKKANLTPQNVSKENKDEGKKP